MFFNRLALIVFVKIDLPRMCKSYIFHIILLCFTKVSRVIFMRILLCMRPTRRTLTVILFLRHKYLVN